MIPGQLGYIEHLAENWRVGFCDGGLDGAFAVVDR